MATVAQPRRRGGQLEAIAAALGIAKDIYGIKTQSANFDRLQQQQEQQAQKFETEQAQQAQMQEAGLGPVDQAKFERKQDIATSGRQQQTLDATLEKNRIDREREAGRIQLKGADDLRKERNNNALTKNTSLIESAYKKMEAVDETAAGDVALIFSFMKINDPGSTVREGEFATAENSAGVPERIKAQYNKILEGERLTPNQRADFLKQGRNQANAQIKRQIEFDKFFTKEADKRGFDMSSVLGGFKPEIIKEKSTKQAPQIEDEVKQIMQQADPQAIIQELERRRQAVQQGNP